MLAVLSTAIYIFTTGVKCLLQMECVFSAFQLGSKMELDLKHKRDELEFKLTLKKLTNQLFHSTHYFEFRK